MTFPEFVFAFKDCGYGRFPTFAPIDNGDPRTTVS
jgi:hypothetical protein